jgi:xanthine dehydrogenase YagR molybdenum-binding subunit
MTEQTKHATEPVTPRLLGTGTPRVDGIAKVTGRAAYAVEHDAEPGMADPLHLWLVTSTVARGRITGIGTDAALAHPGVQQVIDHTTAPRLADVSDGELAILQDDQVHYRGQIVAVVLAETPEAAREGAALVRVDVIASEADVAFVEDGETYVPDAVNAGYETDSHEGDVERGLAESEVVVDATYRTPFEHNNPMEPHALTARWEEHDDGPVLTVVDSTQGVHGVRSTLATLFGLDAERVRVLAPYVGGGFGSKGLPHSPEVAAVLAARAATGRPVKLAVTRQQMFALTGYRTATVSRFRLGARPDGQLVAIDHQVLEQTAAVKEFAEQAATPTRMMYAAPHRRTAHRLARLDVAVPSWMRAPGEMPGMYAHEVAMDELAVACGVDPILVRERNEPETDPETGLPFGNRRLLDCLHEGAERFGWADRPAGPRATQDGEWWVGTGVASATYPAQTMPGNAARVASLDGGRYAVSIGAVDIGTGARTVLAQIAADALEVGLDDVDLEIADTALPPASVAGGSSGTASWGSAIVAAAQRFRADHGRAPDPGVETTASAAKPEKQESHHSFGAVFAEVRVHRWTGEVRVPRLHGTYSVGRVLNPVTGRSQLLGGLVMGLSAGLFEESWRDPRFGHVVTQDLASYHVAAHADVLDLQAHWLDEEDTRVSPTGGRGIGEIGIVGTSAAVANAAYHATGIRVRDLPLTPDLFVE